MADTRSEEVCRSTPLRRSHRRAQAHFRTLRLATPFQPRLDALMKTEDWYDWAGYRAPNSLWDEELEYFAIRSQAARVRHLADGEIPDRRTGRRGLPQPRHPARRVEAQARTRPLHRLVRRRRPCARRRHAVPACRGRASGCAARSGICPGCSTAPSASTCRIAEETEAIAGLALQGPTSFAVLRDAGFAGVEKLKLFDLAEFPHEGGAVTISRTGFTGDLGYELFVAGRTGAVAVGPAVRGRRRSTAFAPSAITRSTAPASRPG